MRILLLQLSDIHFRSISDPVTDRVLKVKEAVLGKFLRADACFIAVSGDVANSGDPAEYSVAVTFFEAIRDWGLFDADEGKDLAVEIREYYIPDFSDWKHHDSYTQGFQNLLRDLKTEDSKAA